MDINLKQSDIEKAVRQYVEGQGISLRNKVLKSTFTMGRGANGLAAAVSIEDVEIPGDVGTAGDTVTSDASAPEAVVQPVAETAVADTGDQAEVAEPVKTATIFGA